MTSPMNITDPIRVFNATRAAFTALGYPWPGPSDRPVIVGLRNPDDPGQWNDIIGVIGGGLQTFYVGTTDPGRKPMDGGSRMVHPAGVARVADGYHRDFFRWHFHKNNPKHPCLGQASPVAFSRWQNGQWVPQTPDIRGFNLHRARWAIGSVPDQVGDYSHGCAVIPDRGEHWELMELLGFPDGKAVTWHGGSPVFSEADAAQRFDYALITIVNGRVA